MRNIKVGFLDIVVRLFHCDIHWWMIDNVFQKKSLKLIYIYVISILICIPPDPTLPPSFTFGLPVKYSLSSIVIVVFAFKCSDFVLKED